MVGPDEHMAACFLLADVNSMSSYRSELEGIFRALKNIEYSKIRPLDVLHWYDNK